MSKLAIRNASLALLSNAGPIIVVLALWEVSIRTGLIKAFFLPAVSDVATQFWASLKGGDLAASFTVTLWRMTVGYAIGCAAAILFGLVIGLSRPLLAFFNPLIAAIYPLPKIALLSLFLVAFGVGDPPIIASVAVSTFFPVLLNTLAGLRSIDPVLIKAARDLGANRYQIAIKVVLPGSLPMILTGLRQSAAVALIVVVGVEMYIGQNGVGHQLAWATQFFDIKLLYTYIVAIGLFGIILFKCIDLIEAFLVPWAPQ
ncbi:MAG: ABC transporter permease [Pseudomonadota bacterium]|jgi:NitT/TauT family transport system permease protein